MRSIDDPRWNLLVNRLAAQHWIGEARRGRWLRRGGVRVDAEARVQYGVYFFSSEVTIGAGTWVNHGSYFDSRAPIVIGSRCDLGMQVMLCTSTHALGPSSRRAGPPRVEGITIGDGCWLGTRALVLPGVQVGDGCVIAAGAVVREDCEPDGLYAGVPARRIRDLER